MKPHVIFTGLLITVQIISFSAAANAQTASTSSASSLAPGSNVTAQTANIEETIKYPVFSQTPSAQDFADTYPNQAQADHREGNTKIRCRASNLRLKDCIVIEEAPAGLGFGDAALKISKFFRIKPLNRDGAPVEGRLVDLRLTWRLAA